MHHRYITILATIGLLFSGAFLLGADQGQGRRADQEALKVYGSLVGPWRGAGQPQRGSSKGAWKETAEWVWKLSPDSAGLELKVTTGKYLKSAILRPKGDGFALQTILADGSSRTFTGKAGERNQLVLTAEGPAAEGLRRITLSPLHDTRFLLLLEGQDPATEAFYRLAEVGYTRQGVAFAAGDSYPLCIVTDGRGTTQVQYQGKTYWVCCSGCKDLFNENPAAVIAEAAERRKAKNKEK
jgi:YHS domain-containing protein